MIRPCMLVTALSALLVPSIASAAVPESSVGGGVPGAITAATALVSALTALVAAIRAGRRAKDAGRRADSADARAGAAEARAQRAAAWADRLANAQSDGVVLVLSYPGTVVSSRALLETNGWRIEYYEITQAELAAGRLLPGPHVVDDVRSADAIVVEGLDPAHMAQLAGLREFRDHISSGAGVALYTGGENYRYDLTLWGECDQGVTTPVTTEGAVRASLARREATARRQGIRPGQLAAARQALIGGAS